jgi:hypothetical protein
MTMKKLLTVLLSGLVFTVSAQSLDKLKTQTKKIYDANFTMDFDAISELTYPKVYEAGGKSAFIDYLDKDHLNDEYRLRIQMESSVFAYSGPKKIDGKSFYVVTYKNPARVFFEKKVEASTAAQKAAWLKERYRGDEVLFEPKRNSFNVRRTSKLVAVSDENTNGDWRFFDFNDPMQRQSFDAIFSADVKKELGL